MNKTTNNHLLIKGLSFQKTEEGEWRVSRIGTNRGTFGMGQNENNILDLQVVERFCSYISTTLRAELEGFLQEEQEDNNERKSDERDV